MSAGQGTLHLSQAHSHPCAYTMPILTNFTSPAHVRLLRWRCKREAGEAAPLTSAHTRVCACYSFSQTHAFSCILNPTRPVHMLTRIYVYSYTYPVHMLTRIRYICLLYALYVLTVRYLLTCMCIQSTCLHVYTYIRILVYVSSPHAYSYTLYVLTIRYICLLVYVSSPHAHSYIRIRACRWRYQRGRRSCVLCLKTSSTTGPKQHVQKRAARVWPLKCRS